MMEVENDQQEWRVLQVVPDSWKEKDSRSSDCERKMKSYERGLAESSRTNVWVDKKNSKALWDMTMERNSKSHCREEKKILQDMA